MTGQFHSPENNAQGLQCKVNIKQHVETMQAATLYNPGCTETYNKLVATGMATVTKATFAHAVPKQILKEQLYCPGNTKKLSVLVCFFFGVLACWLVGLLIMVLKRHAHISMQSKPLVLQGGP
mmetsp:Transcript_135105/g.239032  ORF Transcript_135105/g.239032 Transcript_135105/m.239032 type:complete len:123 (+) Transcript_135105:135-503(+)